ncbi:Rne/Rng family ribonuclease [Rhodospirillaceae bacterium KN72]|uniref:Ribonuclease E n=1 Tax=Pacificispira spongiicola TaxID=2729598 RepID=A0A7Y0HEP7_9PROT|nr:Rne/Rng family ribonuclease [Pacificispira spongiicola]NMM43132.1 Rne/Rng family ribonuclease [Pacificispira spongiicola]
MTRRMLIDATHPEETRVTVVNGNRLEEFDYETTTKQQIKGNIYLAKVTRVEPSLQAAFVEYGGNRHGFLAFSEIHPDYYRIPVGDREELVDDEDGDDNGDAEGSDGDGENGAVEDMGASEGVDEAVEEAARRRPRLRRQYKIQEVIKRRQVMLVQVVKEERGNKGAALTTYLSLAGRYCVVMPNTSRGGGVSRKIANVADRKRLKTILSELEVPEGMAVILRTAGAERSKAEVKRDFDYIMRLWDEIRENTLGSTAPSLIHEEGNLIKRAIRDVYDKDIEEVLVAGDDGYRIAKDFMKALIPSHAKKVQPYKDEQGIPLFHRYQVEQQLALIHEPTVQLRSGGSIVIHQTEALVAIDVNSGKSTRERHIEETALKTNLEAAEEVARQLRLRDLAGLIVIDFIDMDESRNDHAVERRLKEALRRDRARIQVGRISAFGLMEMSRQRLRPSLIEAMSQPCPTCGGVGYIVSTESAALMVTRAIEEEGLRKRASALTVKVPGSVALYVLNHKRSILMDMEARYGFTVTIEAVDGLLPPHYEIQRAGQVEGEEVTAKEERSGGDRPARNDQEEDRNNRRRSRRGGRRRGRRDDEAPRDEFDDAEAAEDVEDTADDQTDGTPETGDSEDDQNRKRRKRGRRGGRRRNRNRNDENPQDQSAEGDAEGDSADDGSDETDGTQSDETGETAAQEGGERSKRRRRGRGRGRGRSAEAQDGTSETDDQTDGNAAPAEASVAAPNEVPNDAPAEVTSAEPEPAEAQSGAQLGAPAESQAESQTEAPEEEAPAKKPRRSRKKAAAAKPEPAEAATGASADAVTEPASEAEQAEPKAAKRKPAKKAAAKKARASRKKAAAAKPEAAEPVAEDAAVEPDAKPETQAAAAAQPEMVTEAAPEPVSEPVSESEPAPEAEPTPEPANDQPKKKGWWNRVLG